MAKIIIENLSAKAGNKILYHNLNVKMHAGETWAVLGRNGVGKTTLLHCCAGLRERASCITLNNNSLQQLSSRQVAQQLAILFQNNELMFPMTVFDAVVAGRYPHRHLWQQLSDNDWLTVNNAIESMELGVLREANLLTLSGGEQRRVAIARVLAQTPEIYLLDEPLNQLDPKYQIRVLNHFSELAGQHNKLVVMTLHDVNIAQRYCTHAIMLFGDGKYLVGRMSDLLCEENLERLYQHKVRRIEAEMWALAPL